MEKRPAKEEIAEIPQIDPKKDFPEYKNMEEMEQ